MAWDGHVDGPTVWDCVAGMWEAEDWPERGKVKGEQGGARRFEEEVSKLEMPRRRGAYRVKVGIKMMLTKKKITIFQNYVLLNYVVLTLGMLTKQMVLKSQVWCAFRF